MSNSHIGLGGDSGIEGALVPAVSEACAPAVSLAPPSIVEGEQQSFSLLKRVISFPAMLGCMLVAVVFGAGRKFEVDPDLWWHIKVGQNLLATHHWPTTDPYSFTVAGNPWIAFEWIGDVLLAAVARFGGLRGLDALMIILGSMIIIAVYVYATMRSGNSKAGFATALASSPIMIISFTLRPQMLGYLFLVLTLIVLELFRQGKPGVLWLLPPMFLIWVNTHGSFIVGIGVIFVYLVCGLKPFQIGEIEAKGWSAGERLRLEFVLLLCLAVLPLTPYGTQLAVYPFSMAFGQPVNVAYVSEWRSMPFDVLFGKIFLVLLLGFFVAQMALRFRYRLNDLVLFVGGTAMACLHARFILLFVPFFAPLMATLLAHWLPSYERAKDKYVLNFAIMLGTAAAMVWYFPSRAQVEQSVARQFPVHAVEYLRSHVVPGPMFNNYAYGGYLVWALPEKKVFIDGRADLYEFGGAFSDYLQATLLQPAAFAVLRAYRIQSCLLDHNQPLVTVLSASPEWEKIYSDEISVLFVRTAAEHPQQTK